jgi:Chaperone of endosialidase
LGSIKVAKLDFSKLLGFRHVVGRSGGAGLAKKFGAELEERELPLDGVTLARAAGAVFNKEGNEASSDVRLKRDIEAVSRLDNGIGLYRYRYLWSDQEYVGVMAQEVESVVPDAVTSGPDGYLRVHYDRLGLRLMTWNEYSAQQGS